MSYSPNPLLFPRSSGASTSSGASGAQHSQNDHKSKGKMTAEMLDVRARDEVDDAVARFFYAQGILFNVMKGSMFHDMVYIINHAPKDYMAPKYDKVQTTLLDKEKKHIDHPLSTVKEDGATYGVSIVSDGWANIKNETLTNAMAVSRGRAMFI
ncbi:hypothetical protein AMTR_s00003p00251040, partial [Amborella trichopoda]